MESHTYRRSTSVVVDLVWGGLLAGLGFAMLGDLADSVLGVGPVLELLFVALTALLLVLFLVVVLFLLVVTVFASTRRIEVSDEGVTFLSPRRRLAVPWVALRSVQVTGSSPRRVIVMLHFEEGRPRGMAIARAHAGQLIEDLRSRRPELPGLNFAGWSAGARARWSSSLRRVADEIAEPERHWLRRQARRNLCGGVLLLYVFTIVGGALLGWWPTHGPIIGVGYLLVIPCAIGFYPLIRRYWLLRRVQRLANTPLPVTAMMMLSRHIPGWSSIYGGESPEDWALLWHPEGVQSPCALCVRLLLSDPRGAKPAGRFAMLSAHRACDDTAALEQVEVLGIPEQGEWVLIRVAPGMILWPRKCATATVAGRSWVSRLSNRLHGPSDGRSVSRSRAA